MAAKQLPSLFTTAEELDNLKRTNQFSIVKVFVEGPDDVKIFNSIVKHKDLGERVEISNRGGRTALLELQEEYLLQKSEIRPQVLFFADQDTWVFTGVPEKYREVNFTKGYSIENDLFEDGELEELLFPEEKKRFFSLIQSISEWFTFQIKLFENDPSKAKMDISFLEHEYILPNNHEINSKHKVDPKFLEREAAMFEDIKAKYTTLLRGKYLFQIIHRIIMDRDKEESLRPSQGKDTHSYFSYCIVGGLKNQEGNCHRIATLLQNTLNSTPPNNLA